MSSPISKAGSRSRRPTGSSALMAGAEKPWNPAAFSPGKTAAPLSPSTSPKCGSRCKPTGATVIREGHGSGEGRGTSPGEVHDISLKAAETDATKRALATFGKPFGLELYRQSRTSGNLPTPKPAADAVAATRFGFHPDDTTPIPRPSRYYGRHQNPLLSNQLQSQPATPAPPLAPTSAHCPPPAKSTRACSPCPNPSADATNPTYALWLPSHASFADGSRATPTICASRSRARWASKSVMSSPSRSAADIIDSSIRPAMKLLGGRRSISMHLSVARQLWEQTHPKEGQTEAAVDQSEIVTKS